VSINRYLPHVLVLPEDDANRELANGFQLDPLLDTRRMQILGVAGGWGNVLDRFREEHIPQMDRYANRFMVLLIDFDDQQDRMTRVRAEIPAHLIDRVFVLGVRTEPENLTRNLGSYETIGKAMAKDCRDNTEVTWTHPLLRHNAGELERLRKHIRPILFSDI